MHLINFKILGLVIHLCICASIGSFVGTREELFDYGSYFQWAMVMELVSKRLRARNSASRNNLLLEISQIEVREDKDKCMWSLVHNGVFSIGALHRLIDDRILPSLDTKTTWDKSLPRKVNIFMRRLKLDRLPHPLNLSSK
ncbi:hypothetical protein Tco_1566535, partial [Tanacetum coccineum]